MKNKKYVSAWFLSHKFTMNILLVHFPGSLNPCSLVFENGANVFFLVLQICFLFLIVEFVFPLQLRIISKFIKEIVL